MADGRRPQAAPRAREGKLTSTKRGVFAPEGAGIEPYDFLERNDLLATEPITKSPGTDSRETVVVTRSWE